MLASFTPFIAIFSAIHPPISSPIGDTMIAISPRVGPGSPGAMLNFRSKNTGLHTVTPKLSIALTALARNIGAYALLRCHRKPTVSLKPGVRAPAPSRRGGSGTVASISSAHNTPGRPTMMKVICQGLRVPTMGKVCGPIALSSRMSQPPTSNATPCPAICPIPTTAMGLASFSRGNMSLVIE